MNSKPTPGAVRRCLVGESSACIGVAETFSSQFFEEPQIERATRALATVVRMHIDRDLDRPAVGVALPMRRPIRVADALTILLGDEPMPACQGLGDSGGEFLHRGNDRFERHRGRLDEGPVDRQKRGGIGLHG